MKFFPSGTTFTFDGSKWIATPDSAGTAKPPVLKPGAACSLCREYNEYADPGTKENPYMCWQCRNGR